MLPADNLRPLDRIVEQRTEKVAAKKNPASRYVGLEHIAQGSPRLLGSLPADASTSVNSIFLKGDILFGKLRPNLRKTWQAIFDGYCSTDILVLKPRADVIGRYAAHLFQFDPIFLEAVRTAEGTKMPRTSWEKLKGFSVFCPTDREQQRIAKILDTVDDAIQQTEKLIAKLRMLKQGLLHDLLTRGVDENGELRDPETFRRTPIGCVPRAWEVTALGDLINKFGGFIQTGPFGSQLHAYEYVQDGVPVIMPQDLKAGGISLDSIARVSEPKARQLSRHKVEPDDLVIARRGDLSACAAICTDQAGWICGTGCLLVRPPRDQIIGQWLGAVYRHYWSQKQVMAAAVGSTMVNLNARILNRLALARPSRAEQEKMVQIIDDSEARLDREQLLLDKLTALRTGLMSDLLSGRTRVRAAMVPA